MNSERIRERGSAATQDPRLVGWMGPLFDPDTAVGLTVCAKNTMARTLQLLHPLFNRSDFATALTVSLRETDPSFMGGGSIGGARQTGTDAVVGDEEENQNGGDRDGEAPQKIGHCVTLSVV